MQSVGHAPENTVAGSIGTLEIRSFAEALPRVAESLCVHGSLGVVVIDASALAGIEASYGIEAHTRAIQELASVVGGACDGELSPGDRIVTMSTDADALAIFLFRRRNEASSYREAMQRLTEIIGGSIGYGLEHRDIALDYAMDFGRGLDRDLCDRFVGMYVNELTRDYGDRGRRAVERFLAEGRAAGLVPDTDAVEFVG